MPENYLKRYCLRGEGPYEGQMLIDVSTEASIEMNDAPSGGATSLRSLWQNGLMGVKVDRWIHWTKRRSEAVQFIDKAQSYAS